MTPQEIQSLRPDRDTSLRVDRPVGFLWEQEPGPHGELIDSAVLFLTNRECPWKCVMCDLWQHTLTESVQPGDIPQQIEFALQAIKTADPNRSFAGAQIKLYNSGSFFDPKAIPTEDDPIIVEMVQRHGFSRVIVECHPAFLGARALQFQSLLPSSTKLEVAMGLESIHPDVCRKLGKGVNAEKYAKAALFLKENDMDHRAFMLVHPPYIRDRESAMEWERRTLEFALIQTEATFVSLIQTRGGNGAMEKLVEAGDWIESTPAELEELRRFGIGLNAGRVLVDQWTL